MIRCTRSASGTITHRSFAPSSASARMQLVKLFLSLTHTLCTRARAHTHTQTHLPAHTRTCPRTAITHDHEKIKKTCRNRPYLFMVLHTRTDRDHALNARTFARSFKHARTGPPLLPPTDLLAWF